MAKPTGFIEFGRETPGRRPVPERVHDWLEVYVDFPTAALNQQAARRVSAVATTRIPRPTSRNGADSRSDKQKAEDAIKAKYSDLK